MQPPNILKYHGADKHYLRQQSDIECISLVLSTKNIKYHLNFLLCNSIDEKEIKQFIKIGLSTLSYGSNIVYLQTQKIGSSKTDLLSFGVINQ